MEAKLLLTKPDKKNYFNISVSKAKTYKDCQAKFKFAYIEKLPKKDWEYLKFGKFLHEILENFHKILLTDTSLKPHLVMTDCFKQASKNWAMSSEQKKESFEILSKYLKMYKDETATCLAVEKEFSIEIDGTILLYGFIDKVQRDADGVIHVIDYKTSKSPKFLEKDFLQLLTYAYSLYLENPSLNKIRASYLLLKYDLKLITKEFDISEIIKIKDIFFDYAEKIKIEKDFSPSPGPLCNYCDWLDKCDAGSKFTKLDLSYGLDSWSTKE